MFIYYFGAVSFSVVVAWLALAAIDFIERGPRN
jgi:hypothetical protein